MKNLHALLATALMGLMLLGCALPVLAQTHMDNPKFERRAEPVLGMNQQELIEALGKPKSIKEGGCAVPLKLDSQKNPIPVFGNAWLYLSETENAGSRMILCVVNGHAIAEQRTHSVLKGKRLYHSDQSVLDLELLEKAFRGELEESTHEERTEPHRYDGPEYEI